MEEQLVQTLRLNPIRFGSGTVGRAAATGEPIQVADILNEQESSATPTRSILRELGYRSLLAIPLIREGRVMGGLSVYRRQAGSFSTEMMNLLQTFATQSILAIQNARLFREIEDKSSQLEDANRYKSEFVANMSHELRTPLNAIIGYSEMLEEEAADLDQKSFIPDLQKINGAGKHLMSLINNVLDLSKIEAGKMELYLERFPVSPMLEDLASTMTPLVEKNRNRLEIHCPAEMETMFADARRVRQVLLNLLSNACKFTEDGVISLEAEKLGGLVCFRVRDTGIGMTREQIDRLFQAFMQADASVTRKYGGTGLGLVISKRFCQMMGGDLTVQSEHGKGSTFLVTLPEEVTESRPELAMFADVRLEPTARGATDDGGIVLVIDDDRSARDLMVRFISKEGARVVTAWGGEEGLRLARELHPSIITLDVLMPGMDGWAVLRELKSDPELTSIPVVMITMEEDRSHSQSLGASDLLIKPIQKDKLMAVLNKYRKQ
jgi:signal transduction histidine kinase/CheY-like chemotaxis protein